MVHTHILVKSSLGYVEAGNISTPLVYLFFIDNYPPMKDILSKKKMPSTRLVMCLINYGHLKHYLGRSNILSSYGYTNKENNNYFKMGKMSPTLDL